MVKSEMNWMSSRKLMMEMRSCGLAVLRKSRAALRIKSIRSSTLPETSSNRTRLNGSCVGTTFVTRPFGSVLINRKIGFASCRRLPVHCDR